jgi:hypothetical protein
MTARRSHDEFDTDEVKAINKFIANAPSYFEKTDEMYKLLFQGDGVKQPSLVSLIVSTQKNVDTLLSVGKSITMTVITFLIITALGGILFLIRIGPALERLAAP